MAQHINHRPILDKGLISKYKRSGSFKRDKQKYLRMAFATSKAINASARSTDSSFLDENREINEFLNEKGPNQMRNEVNNVDDLSGSYDDNEDIDIRVGDAIAGVRRWAIKHAVGRNAITDLLSEVLNKLLPGKFPTDGRTVLMTPKSVEVTNFEEGCKYWHQGVIFCLKKAFWNLQEDKSILLNINVDGLPIFNSTTEQFWPILANVEGIIKEPFVIGIYSGNKKPPSLGIFLDKFVDEMNDIIENGIMINGFRLTVGIRCFICDSPARAFVKGIKNFNSKHGCTKCDVKGFYSMKSRRTYFPATLTGVKRTDSSFRNRIDSEHHKEMSPLENLPINMVDDFIVADPLHLIHLGIVKRYLQAWCTTKCFLKTKWSTSQKICINSYLETIKLPKEIHREVRGLHELAQWKGTEYRSYFFYVSIVVFKQYMEKKLYVNFLYLYAAVTICSNNIFKTKLNVAEKLFHKYVKDFAEVFGADTIGSNMHQLLHVVDEVKRFGCLDSISAYPFESKLYRIKKLLKTGHSAIVQAAKRITEANFLPNTEGTSLNKLKYPVMLKPLTLANQIFFHELKITENFLLSNVSGNQWFLTKKNEIVMFEKTVMSENKILIYGYKLPKLIDYFIEPLSSSTLNIFSTHWDAITKLKTTDIYVYGFNDVKCILVSLDAKHEEKFVFIPLMHTYRE